MFMQNERVQHSIQKEEERKKEKNYTKIIDNNEVYLWASRQQFSLFAKFCRYSPRLLHYLSAHFYYYFIFFFFWLFFQFLLFYSTYSCSYVMQFSPYNPYSLIHFYFLLPPFQTFTVKAQLIDLLHYIKMFWSSFFRTHCLNFFLFVRNFFE